MAEPDGVPPDSFPEGSTHRRFLDAGARVFASNGYAGASMEQVADDACLSRAALYKHFANKETLFLAIAEDVHAGASQASAAVAARARTSRRPANDVIIDFMMARFRHVARQIGASAHAAELFEETSRRCGAINQRNAETFRSALIDLIVMLAADQRIRLKPTHSPADLANMLTMASKAIKSVNPLFGQEGQDAAFILMAKTLLSGATVPTRANPK